MHIETVQDIQTVIEEIETAIGNEKVDGFQEFKGVQDIVRVEEFGPIIEVIGTEIENEKIFQEINI